MVERLGWTLLHFLWEGVAVALVLAVALFVSRRASAAFRYGLASVALAILAGLPVATYLTLEPRPVPSGATSSGRAAWSAGEAFLAAAAPDGRMPLLVGVWAFGIAVLSLRLVGSLVQVERWKRRSARPADAEWTERFAVLGERLGLRRRVALLVSDRIEVPSAWGVVRPLVVLPASLLGGLPVGQVEAILLHELAHIRRHDYLVNLLQSVVETALFYHPAVWWVSSVVRREREHCCDDVVVAALGDPIPYARALLRLEERRQRLPRPALSAKEGKLMNRIARILGAQPAPIRVSPLASTLAALGILGAILGGTLQAQAQTAKPTAKAKVKIRAKVKPTTEPAKKATKIVAPKPLRAKADPLAIRIKGTKVELTGNVVGERAVDESRFATYPAAVAAQADAKPLPRSGQTKAAAKPVIVPATATSANGTKNVSRATATITTEAQRAPSSSGQAGAGGFGGVTGGGFPASGQGGGGGFGGFAPGQSFVRGANGFSGGISGQGGFGFASNQSEVTVGVTDGKVSVDANRASLAAVLRKLAKETKLSWVIAPGYYDDLTMVLIDQPPTKALEVLFRAAKAKYRVESGVYYIESDVNVATATPFGR